MRSISQHGVRSPRTALLLMALTPALLAAVGAMPQKTATSRQKSPSDSRAVFERRILPLLRAANPSSCAECHLSGVDLKQYIRASETETFASLRDQGLIDTRKPAGSRLLRLIQMSTPRSPLLTRKARQREYEAFRAWIETAARNPKVAAAPVIPAVKRAGPIVSNTILRHTRLDRVVTSFTRNIWSQEGRCMGCHRPGTSENTASVQKYGQRVSWFVPEDPEATMRKIIAQGLVNVKAPEQSLLLLKPLNRVPHGGGVKMLYGDTSYQMFRAWIEDYAASVQGRYRTERDLPASLKTGLAFTGCILGLNETPETWVDKNVRTDIFAWDRSANEWAKTPVATGERQVSSSRDTNLLIFVLVPAGSAQEQAAWREAHLNPGRYLLKYYVDVSGKSASGYKTPTNSPAFYQGQQEIAAEWKPGWGAPTRVSVALE